MNKKKMWNGTVFLSFPGVSQIINVKDNFTLIPFSLPLILINVDCQALFSFLLQRRVAFFKTIFGAM